MSINQINYATEWILGVLFLLMLGMCFGGYRLGKATADRWYAKQLLIQTTTITDSTGDYFEKIEVEYAPNEPLGIEGICSSQAHP